MTSRHPRLSRGMLAAVLLLAAPIAACTEPEPEQTSQTDPVAWADDIVSYCTQQDSGWMMDALSRIDTAIAGPFDIGSLQLRGTNVQKPFDGQTGAKELEFRLIAMREGETVQLSAYAYVKPDSCSLIGLHVIEGYNRFEPPFRVDLEDE